MDKIWKVVDLINWGKDYLEKKNISDARLNIELLLCSVIKCKRFDLYLNFDKPLLKEELAAFKALLLRRLHYEPLQYILGETEFMGIPFILNSSVLIPRPETENLVEKCLDYCKANFKDKEIINILDIGTGSGNIAVSLAKLIENSVVTAIDINEAALHAAGKNAEANLVSHKINFILMDILKETPAADSKFDLIVSNPPYINQEEYNTLQPEILKFEPVYALTDYSDGLTFYKRISSIAKNHLNKNNLLAFEIAYNQGNDLKEILTTEGYGSVEITKDYSQNDRIASAIYSF